MGVVASGLAGGKKPNERERLRVGLSKHDVVLQACSGLLFIAVLDVRHEDSGGGFCVLAWRHGASPPSKKNQVAGFPGVIPRPLDVVAKARRGTRAGGNTPQSTPDPKRAKSQGGEGEDGPENVGEEVPEEGGDATVVSSGGICARIVRRRNGDI